MIERDPKRAGPPESGRPEWTFVPGLPERHAPFTVP